jgi:hypothetical protein
MRRKKDPWSIPTLDMEQFYRWLKFGDIKGETESTVVAAQDEALSTK